MQDLQSRGFQRSVPWMYNDRSCLLWMHLKRKCMFDGTGQFRSWGMKSSCPIGPIWFCSGRDRTGTCWTYTKWVCVCLCVCQRSSSVDSEIDQFGENPRARETFELAKVRFRTSKLRAWAVPSEVQQLELNLTIPERLWSRHSCFWAFSAYLGTTVQYQDVKTYQDVSRRTRVSSDFVFSALLPSPWDAFESTKPVRE